MGFPIGDLKENLQKIVEKGTQDDSTQKILENLNNNNEGAARNNSKEVPTSGDLSQSVEDASLPGNTCCCSPEQ